MHKEQVIIEAKKKPEAQENHETSQSVELPEDLRRQMMSESEKETTFFKGECADGIAQAESRAGKDGLVFDGKDKNKLESFSEEADETKTELLTAINGGAEINETVVEKTDIELNRKTKNIREYKRDISGVFESVLKNKVKVENIYTEIDKIQLDIDSLQVNSIKKIFNYFKINKLNKERLTKEEQISLLRKDISSAEQLIIELSDQIEVKDKTEKILKYTKDHFKDSPEYMDKIEKIEKEHEMRSIKSSIIRNNAFIFHGIKDKKSGDVKEQESALKQEVSQDVRIKIAMALEPSLSTSSFRNDGAKQRLWSDIGLLLREGHIDAADSSDMHTEVKGINDRDNLKITTTSDIDRIMMQKRKTWDGMYWYNEIVVRNPKYAGLCVSSLEINKDLAKLSEELDIPIFFHDGKGRVFETALQSETNKFILIQGREVTPSDIANSKYDISQEKRKSLIQEVVKEDIFHIDERMKDVQLL